MVREFEQSKRLIVASPFKRKWTIKGLKKTVYASERSGNRKEGGLPKNLCPRQHLTVHFDGLFRPVSKKLAQKIVQQILKPPTILALKPNDRLV